MHAVKTSALQALNTALSGGLARIPRAVRMLALLMALSYVSGIVACALGKNAKTCDKPLTVRTLITLLARKAMELIIVLLASLLDAQLGSAACTAAATTFYILVEAFSILNSAMLLGVPVPQKLRDTLEAAKRLLQGSSSSSGSEPLRAQTPDSTDSGKKS